MTWEELLSQINEALTLTTVEEMAAKLAEISSAVEAAIADVSDEEMAKAEQVVEQLAKLKKTIGERNKKSALQQRAKDLSGGLVVPSAPPAPVVNTRVTVKATPTKYFADREDAILVGHFLRSLGGHSTNYHLAERSRQWLKDRAFQTRTLTEGNNAGAGLLVPEPMANSIWDRKESFGAARRLANVVQMNGPTFPIIKNLGGIDTYFIGETGAPTASEPSLQHLTLTAKKLGARSFYSIDLEEDASLANVADWVTGEISYAFTVTEDACFFNGDGTSTYGQMIGFTQIYKKILEDAGGTWTNDTHKGYLGSLVVQGTGTTAAGLAITDLPKLLSKVKRYAGADFRWSMHPSILNRIAELINAAAGGAATADFRDGIEPRLYGFPVELVESMPAYDSVAANQVYILFGDLAAAGEFGVRRDITIASQSTGTNFSNGIVEVLGTQRFGTLIHDVGNYSATAATRDRGSVAGLSTRNA